MLRRLTLLCLMCASLLVGAARAAEGDTFKVAHIRVEGLVRISEGTLFNYLPIQPGDTVDPAKIATALRTVYKAGFFKDVQFRRDGDDLVIVVAERPAIASFTITGNKEIKTEDLDRVLVRNGLADGRIFDRSTLDQVTQELVRQYHSRGRYGVKIATDVLEVGANQVKITITIKEGEISGIRQINIVGNNAFSTEQLRDSFELTTPTTFSWLTENDRYAREKLGGDLEKLRSFYMDRGYADFKLESTQVAVSPDRRGVYITINIHEGEVYKVKDVKLLGSLPIPEAELRQFVLLRGGSQFSMAAVNASVEYMNQRFGNEGYAFSEITPYPELDRDKKEVSITFLVEAGSRAYVRHVNFHADSGTDDEVYRREMRQLEGTWLSNSQVDRSRLRIARLPFVEDVQHKVEKVPGSEDLVDVNFEIKERRAGTFNAGVGFGGTTTGAFLDFSIVHSNFLGTGDRVSISLTSRSYAQSYNISITEPYWTIDGVSRTITAFYTTASSLGQNLESFSRENFGGSLSFRWPLSEYSALSFGTSISRTDLAAPNLNSSQQLFDFVTNPNNGEPYTINTGFGNITSGLRYRTLQFSGGWSYDTRNRAIFADRGNLAQVSLDIATYPGDANWWSARASELTYFPLPAGFTYGINAELAIVQPFSVSSDVPPDRKLYAGGADSVRGFRESYLGPGYTVAGRFLPIGGDLRFNVQNEFIIPNFFADDPRAPPKNGRFSLFVDTGMVFRSPHDFSFGALRASAGLAATFLTPIGAMRFSFAFPFRYMDTDQTERFQFTIGTLF